MEETDLNNFFANSTFEANIKEMKTGKNWLLAVLGFILCAGALAIFYWGDKDSDHFNVFVIAISGEIAGIICFLIYRSLAVNNNHLDKQLLMFKNLHVAIKLAGELTDKNEFEKVETNNNLQTTTRKEFPKTKMQQQIIQTLLSKYSG